MTSSISHHTIDRLFDAAASEQPTPGGGAITAVTGALGISLLLKALRISLKTDEARMEHRSQDEQLVAIATELYKDADRDTAAYGRYIEALKLPKGSEDEKATRSAATKGAARASASAALDCLDHAASALEVARQIEPHISKMIVADLSAGIGLLRVTVSNAEENAQANIASLKGDAGSYTERLEAALERIRAIG